MRGSGVRLAAVRHWPEACSTAGLHHPGLRWSGLTCSESVAFQVGDEASRGSLKAYSFFCLILEDGSFLVTQHQGSILIHFCFIFLSSLLVWIFYRASPFLNLAHPLFLTQLILLA
ncbi:hypothetical protein BS78_01G290700 [Paspalum vaginatum]|nr:hypothetical protein BS78_01G290700 [Paspalum vaginatum]